MRFNNRHREDANFRATIDDVLHAIIDVGIGDENKLGACCLVEGKSGDASQIARTINRNRHLARIFLVERDQLSQILRSHAGMGHDELVGACDKHHRLIILERIIRQILHHEGVGDERGRCREEESVAIGLGARDSLRTNDIAAAGLVFNDDAFAQFLAELFSQHTRHHIRACACGLRDDESDGTAWPLFLRNRGKRERECERCCEAGNLHGCYSPILIR